MTLDEFKTLILNSPEVVYESGDGVRRNGYELPSRCKKPEHVVIIAWESLQHLQVTAGEQKANEILQIIKDNYEGACQQCEMGFDPSLSDLMPQRRSPPPGPEKKTFQVGTYLNEEDFTRAPLDSADALHLLELHREEIKTLRDLLSKRSQRKLQLRAVPETEKKVGEYPISFVEFLDDQIPTRVVFMPFKGNPGPEQVRRDLMDLNRLLREIFPREQKLLLLPCRDGEKPAFYTIDPDEPEAK